MLSPWIFLFSKLAITNILWAFFLLYLVIICFRGAAACCHILPVTFIAPELLLLYLPFQLNSGLMFVFITGCHAAIALAEYTKNSVMASHEKYMNYTTFQPINYHQDVVVYTCMQLIFACLATLDLQLLFVSTNQYIR